MGKCQVDAAVAHAKDLGNVHHCGLGQAEAAKDVFGGVQDALFRQYDGGRAHFRPLSSMASWPAS